MAEKLAIAVIGAGHRASAQMRALQKAPNGRLVAVMDLDTQRANAAAEEHGVKGYDNLDAVLSEQDVEAVVVAVPNRFHAEIAIAAARAGKHVLVEHPMALCVSDCDQMIEANKAAGKVLMVGSYRHDPMHRKVKSLIAEGPSAQLDN